MENNDKAMFDDMMEETSGDGDEATRRDRRNGWVKGGKYKYTMLHF